MEESTIIKLQTTQLYDILCAYHLKDEKFITQRYTDTESRSCALLDYDAIEMNPDISVSVISHKERMFVSGIYVPYVHRTISDNTTYENILRIQGVVDKSPKRFNELVKITEKAFRKHSKTVKLGRIKR